jgi:hypothetical protein
VDINHCQLYLSDPLFGKAKSTHGSHKRTTSFSAFYHFYCIKELRGRQVGHKTLTDLASRAYANYTLLSLPQRHPLNRCRTADFIPTSKKMRKR